jgi:hypothetical protein
LKEGNTVRDLGVTSMTSIAGTPTHWWGSPWY